MKYKCPKLSVKALIDSGEMSIRTGPFGTQLKASEYQNSGIPVLNVKNLGFSNVCTDKLDRVGKITADRLEGHLLKSGDIVFGRKGAVERHAFISEKEDGWLQGSDCIRMRIASSRISPRYVSYYFLTQQHKNFMTGMCSHGTTMASLNQKILEKIELPLPSRIIQDKISLVLKSLDDKIALNQKINENLEQQAQAVFDNYYESAENTVPFSDAIQILGGGTPKTTVDAYWNGLIPFFTPKDVGAPYTLVTEKNITEEGLDHCNSKLYPVNTVFVTARGTVGKIGLAGVPMAMNQSCYALVEKNNNQLLTYFYVRKVVDKLKKKANGAVFDAITTRDFTSESILQLSNKDENSFVSIAEPMYQSILFRQRENQRLADLRDTLLPKLMSGEIDVEGVEI